MAHTVSLATYSITINPAEMDPDWVASRGAAPGGARGESEIKIEAQYQRESDPVRQAKLLAKLGPLEVERARAYLDMNDQEHALSVVVVRDDFVREYPGEYIGKCIEAFERFDLPEETRERYKVLFDVLDSAQKLTDGIRRTRRKATKVRRATGPGE